MIRMKFFLKGFLFSLFLILPFSIQAAKIENVAGTPVSEDFLLEKGKTELILSPGQLVNEEISIINRSGKRVEFRLVMEDVFAGKGYAPGLTFSDAGPGPYSLRPFISLKDDSFYLEHGQKATIPVSIKIPDGAKAGGLYGAVTFIASVSGADSGLDARFESFTSLNKIFLGTPAVFEVGFANEGNIAVSPNGKIVVSSMVGGTDKEIAVDQFYVMPESSRRQQYSVDDLPSGLYKARAELQASEISSVSSEIYFCVLPALSRIILAGIIVLILIFLVFRFLKAYKKKSLK
ncbi:MAG: hypothetical protein BWY53_00469 [Parcubacteria group bacterium ADurb.Bin326]|nr:MAG: hypothetical protein BWY53_00469 [Parcubacteria group bacterium ADurb.Bin326]